jgi:3-methyladenine DNA glycosylase/8-oxoguanine DNA glycosylase
MKRLIAKHGRCPLAEREFEPFHMLANSIISQQLSTKAAATLKQRVGAYTKLQRAICFTESPFWFLRDGGDYLG